jgi:hypothetical protein
VLKEGGDELAAKRVRSPRRLEGVLVLVVVLLVSAIHLGCSDERQETPQLREILSASVCSNLCVVVANLILAPLNARKRASERRSRGERRQHNDAHKGRSKSPVD